MTETSTWLRRRSVLIVTHTYTTGPASELRDYLLPRARVVGYVAHPFSYADDTRSSFTLYVDGQEMRHSVASSLHGPDLLFYAKDTLLTTLYMLAGQRQYDLAIAVDPLNVAAMLPWRRLGLVKKLIFYTIDYTPRRFAEPLLNTIYHAMDRAACYHSDLMWNLSDRMVGARRDNGVSPRRTVPQMTVPTGNHFERAPRFPMDQIDRYAVAYLGHLVPKGGVDLLVRCFPLVVAAVPRASLIVVGGGPMLDSLRKLAQELRIEDHVVFHGHVQDHQRVEEIVSRCAIAAAPYVPDEMSVSAYTDVNKPKIYLAAGLPVVLTSVPESAQPIVAAGAGTLVDYTIESLAGGIINLLSDESALRAAREAAVTLGATFTWDSIFDNAFDATLHHLARR